MNAPTYASQNGETQTLIFPPDSENRVLTARKHGGVWMAREKVNQSCSPSIEVDVTDLQSELDTIFSKAIA